MRFIGNISAKSDGKGRFFLPAVFRKVLQGIGEERLVLRRDVFQSCLVLYPESVWNSQVDEIVAATPRFDRERRALLRQFVADAEVLSLDANGRLLIPKRYLLMAGIEQEVSFLGMDDTIEIWAKSRTERPFLENDAFADGLEKMMTEGRKETDETTTTDAL
jgi:MraZ protein